MIDRFTIHLTNPGAPRGWMWVVIYDTVEALRAAANRYSPDDDWDDTAACFQGRGFRIYVTDGKIDIPAEPYAGVLRMLPTQGGGVLAHECTHAALAMFYRQHAPSLDVDRDMADEEALCYAVGDLVGAVSTAMFARGHWA